MAEGRSPSHAARLLKTLVVAGASLGLSGCGGESRRTVEGTGGSPAPTGAGGMGAAAGMANGGRAGDVSMPVYTGDVEGCLPPRRVCACTYEPAYFIDCTFDHPWGYYSYDAKLLGMDCQCDETRPTVPESCAYPQQFTCIAYAPEYEECICNSDAPRTKDDCGPNRYFQCDGSDPEIGCDCIVGIK